MKKTLLKNKRRSNLIIITKGNEIRIMFSGWKTVKLINDDILVFDYNNCVTDAIPVSEVKSLRIE